MSHPRQISRQTSTRNKIAELGSGTADTISVLAHLENLMTRGLVGRIRQPVGHRPRLLFTRLLGRELRSDPFVSPTARAKFRA